MADPALTSEPVRTADPARPADRRTGYRADLEGLRGLAILLVVAYHAGLPGFTGGYVGVDVFFVLSGYLITRLLIREIDSTGRIDFAAFYARRARRLLPAAFTVILVTLLVGRVLYAPFEHGEIANAALAATLYVSNIAFARSAIDYLAETDRNPLLHTWSLGVEEQFYLFWPAVVWFAYAAHRRAGGRRLVTTLVLLGAASYALSVWLTGRMQPFAFFLLPTRAWEFAIGALACMLPATMRIGRAPAAVAWLGVSAIALAGVRFGAATPFPGALALIPAGGTALVLAAGARDERAGPLRLLTAPTMQRLGRLSYSWYLWHWPVLIYGHLFPGLRGVAPSVALALLALGLAAATHVLVENPIRFHPAIVRRPRIALVMALLLTVGGALAAAGVRISGARQAASPTQLAYLEARALPSIYADGCHLSIVATEQPPCEYGDTSAATAIVLFGDSHAAQWFPALDAVARERGLALVSMTKSGCPAASVALRSPQLGRMYTECAQWRSAALERILALRPAAVVIASYGGFIAPEGTFEPWSISVGEWEAGVRRTASRLLDAGIPAILLADTPVPDFDVPSCLARAAWTPSVHRRGCAFDRSAPAIRLEHEIARAVVAALPGLRFVDLTDAICAAEPCEPAAGGVIRFRDSHHLTTRFAASLAPLLARAILPDPPGDPPHGTQRGAEHAAAPGR